MKPLKTSQPEGTLGTGSASLLNHPSESLNTEEMIMHLSFYYSSQHITTPYYMYQFKCKLTRLGRGLSCLHHRRGLVGVFVINQQFNISVKLVSCSQLDLQFTRQTSQVITNTSPLLCDGNIHQQHSTYRGLGLLCVEVLQRVQGRAGLYFGDGTRRGHSGRERQSVGHQRGWNRGHLDVGPFTTNAPCQ